MEFWFGIDRDDGGYATKLHKVQYATYNCSAPLPESIYVLQ